VTGQTYLFEEEAGIGPGDIHPRLWAGSFNGRESSLHQLSPYVGKLKSGMVRVLLQVYSSRGDWVLDPFCGSGVVPFESLLLGRCALANDLNRYAYVLTMGKLTAPFRLSDALARANRVIEYVERTRDTAPADMVPEFVSSFFHPKTLREVIRAFEYVRKHRDYFTCACLLGILHHVRPGFLSYPASHLTPYLRKAKYPPSVYPEMYSYRELKPRLLAKVRRMYRRPGILHRWRRNDYRVFCKNAMELPVAKDSVDLILSSPPYFGALDYARDNRLRLWFLGVKDWRALDRRLTASVKVYIPQMSRCIAEMYRVLRMGRYCILILGDVERSGKRYKTAEMIRDLAAEVTEGGFEFETMIVDQIPDERRSRRKTRTTKVEKVLVLKKSR